MTTERELIEQHTRRSAHGPKRFDDGFPEHGTPEYEALGHAERLRICEERSGIFRDPGDESTAPTVTPRPYAARDPILNPIDRWEQQR